MPFSFLMISLLGAATLAAGLAIIPLIVHLLHRQKVTPVAWGAMQFLLESPLRVRRRRKIDNWLLMLLRMAILILLALLLCRPVWRTSTLATSAPVDIALVIDHSLTMGMRSSGTNTPVGPAGQPATATLFSQALDLAQHVSTMLPSTGTISIVLAEHAPRIITPAPIRMTLAERAPDGTPRGNWADQLQILRTLKPGMTRGDIPSAVAAARELLSHGNNPRKIILVLSDHQRTAWNPGDDKAWTAALGHIDVSSDRPGAIPVFSIPLKGFGSGTPLANATVRGVQVLPEFLGIHRPAQIVATISNSGSIDLTAIPVVLEVDGKTVMNRPLPALAVGQSVTVRFDYYFPDPGSHWVRVRADFVDALEADNAATAAVNVKPTLPVLVVDGQLTSSALKPADSVGAGRSLDSFPQAAFLLDAMQPVDPSIDSVTLVKPTLISAADLASPAAPRLEDFPIVVLNDVPRLTGGLVDRLAAHAQAGNGVWIILGPRTEESFLNDVLARHSLVPLTTKGIAHPPPPDPGMPPSSWVAIDIKEPANRALTLLTNAGQAEHSAQADVALRAWWSVTPVLPETRTIMATTTGDPLVLETPMGKLGGIAIVWTTSVDYFGGGQWNNLPVVPTFFVPLVNETLFNLASGQDAGQPRQVDSGQPLTWTGGGGASQPIESVQLLCPDTSTRTLNPELRGNHYFVEERDTSLPGLYEMRFAAPAKAGATAPPPVFFSVNLDPDELDPATLDPADLDWFQGHDFLKGIIGNAGVPPAAGPETPAAPATPKGPLTLAQALQATRGGLDFWPYLALALLALLVTEVAMTFFLVRQQAGKTLEEDNLQSVMPKDTIQGGNSGSEYRL